MQQIFVSKVFELLLKHKFADFQQKNIHCIIVEGHLWNNINIFIKKKSPKTLSSSCKREKLRNIVPCLKEIHNSSIRFLKRIITVLKK